MRSQSDLPYSIARAEKSSHAANHFTVLNTIDDNAKDGGPGWSDLHVVITMILCGTNFSIWQDMELISTGYLQIASN